MTGLQEIQDEIFGLEASLAGKRLELAMGQGERDTARQHLHSMKQAMQARRAFRVGLAGDTGQCFFVASADADRIAVGGEYK